MRASINRPVRAALAALALLAAAATAPAAPAPRVVELRLFHASAPALEAAGVPLGDLIDAADARQWDVRPLDHEQWRALLATLAAAEAVHEVAIPGAAQGLRVTRESPWQVDGSVVIALASDAPGSSAVQRAELPLRVACWMQSDADDAPVHLEALVPTGHAREGGDVPLATRVELTLANRPLAAIAVACHDGACEANLLAARVAPRDGE